MSSTMPVGTRLKRISLSTCSTLSRPEQYWGSTRCNRTFTTTVTALVTSTEKPASSQRRFMVCSTRGMRRRRLSHSARLLSQMAAVNTAPMLHSSKNSGSVGLGPKRVCTSTMSRLMMGIPSRMYRRSFMNKWRRALPSPVANLSGKEGQPQCREGQQQAQGSVVAGVVAGEGSAFYPLGQAYKAEVAHGPQRQQAGNKAVAGAHVARRQHGPTQTS